MSALVPGSTMTMPTGSALADFEPSVGAGLAHSYPETRIGAFDFYVATCTEPLAYGSADVHWACGDSWPGHAEGLCCFTQEDPILLTSLRSSYRYVSSNPMGAIDPSGAVDILLIDPKRYPGSARQNISDRRLVELFDKIESAEDEITIGAHGTYWGDLVSFHIPISPKDMAERIRQHARWRPGMKVRLIACYTGADPKRVSPKYKKFIAYSRAYAQELADELGAIVFAPDGEVRPQPDGTVKPELFVDDKVLFWPSGR